MMNTVIKKNNKTKEQKKNKEKQYKNRRKGQTKHKVEVIKEEQEE